MSDEPTIQNVIPTYYLITHNICAQQDSDSQVISVMKTAIIGGMNEKYWSSTTDTHKIACMLDPSFKGLHFIAKQSEKADFIQTAENGIITLMNADDAEVRVSEPKRMRVSTSEDNENDPFLALRSGVIEHRTEHNAAANQLKEEFRRYLNKDYSVLKPNLCEFWSGHQLDFPVLSSVAKKILVIQASSAESERHFSSSGEVVREKRSRLSPSCVEALTVLKEAQLNKLWP